MFSEMANLKTEGNDKQTNPPRLSVRSESSSYCYPETWGGPLMSPCLSFLVGTETLGHSSWGCYDDCTGVKE